MSWNQNEYNEFTKALRATLDEPPVRGKLTHIASFEMEGVIRFFEQQAKTAPESLPEAPWERCVNASPKCECGECDGAGWIYVEGKGVKFCNARSSRSGQSKGRPRESGETKSDSDRLDLKAIFQRRG